MRHLIPPHQRPYVASHPLGLFFSIGVALEGFLNLVAPGLSSSSASAQALDPTVLTLFNLTWVVGGGLSMIGLLRGFRKSEAGGMSLLGGAFGAYYIVIVGLVPGAWATGLFIICLSIGCFLRARHLARTGYVTLEVSRDVRSH